MCGIAIAITRSSHEPPHAYWPSVLHNVSRRGPDSLRTHRHRFHAADAQPWTLALTSSVLSLRGEGVTQQPLASADARLLLAWNGQVFDTIPTDEASPSSSARARLDAGENDARVLLDRIESLLCARAGCEDALGDALGAALAEVEGPYAFALLDTSEDRLFFGRDPLGRRSLLLHRCTQSLAIASVASTGLLASSSEATLDEVDCASLWSLDLARDPTRTIPVARTRSAFTAPLVLSELRPDARSDEGEVDFDAVRDAFGVVLAESVRRRVTGIATEQREDEAHVGVLFSGGLDCTTLALLAHRFVPVGQPIDLLNVAFENPRALQAARALRAQQQRSKARKSSKPSKRRPAAEPKTPDVVGAGEAVGAVVEQEEGGEDVYAVPDRETGLASYAELCTLAPGRRWNFVAINVPYAEYTQERDEVTALMAPSRSVMDMSIAAALYFASRARGVVRCAPYASPARVLLSGLGADELLGGYSRHRHAYTSSLSALVAELQLDLDRLPSRNLGRDDRIIASHAREARYPFLDRTVLDFLTSIPTTTKLDLPTLASPRSGGDKFLLRSLAHHLGLQVASTLPKRAMQFGTRAAKIDPDSARAKGHHALAT